MSINNAQAQLHTSSFAAPYPTTWSVALLGETARRGWSIGGAVVEAVFERSFYVRNDDRALLCIGHSEIGAGPLNCLCHETGGVDWRDRGLRPQLRGHFDVNRLHLGDQLLFDASSAKLWTPLSCSCEWNRDDVRASIDVLSMQIAQFDAARSGLMSFVFANDDVRSSDHACLHKALSRRVGRGVSATGNWLDRVVRRRKDLEIRQEVLSLVGLGPGLTPAGDDFLGGVLIALHALGYTAARERLASRLLPHARNQTNAISYQHLCSAAEGQGAAPLHDTMIAVCRGDRERIGSFLPAVDSIGHSSGWDALAGIATVLLAVCRYAKHFPSSRKTRQRLSGIQVLPPHS